MDAKPQNRSAPPRPEAAPPATAGPRVSSRVLLQGGCLWIEHRGTWYRLRETRKGRLILTK
ncbi:MAG: hypothetical protein KatS3mg121_0145 [Gammaproteobacteria bacterium]|nr:MAG: hypothetical protein KatS3mg121_0145 [Gammaproteobacteria bacterium]